MRVVSLQAQNILRLSAVVITWDKDKSLLTIGGANGAGKSSAVQCVAMALGGLALCPEEPLKRGEDKGFVELDLGELLVRREFWRTPATESEPEEIKSRLTVRNPEGMKLEPAQKLLDRLISKFSFDPTAFVFEEPKRQDEILRKIVNLDVTQYDADRKAAYDRRAFYNKQVKEKTTLANAMPHYDGLPPTEVPVDTVVQELRDAEGARKVVEQSYRDLNQAQQQFQRLEADCQRRYAEMDALRAKLEQEQKALDAAVKQFEWTRDTVAECQNVFDVAKAALPDEEAIRARFKDLETTNTHIRANQARDRALEAVKEIAAKADAEAQALATADDLKRKALAAVTFPVPGLGLSDGGVVFNGLPFKQASTSEQIRVSVAIGFALNPGLKLLCVRNGNALDEDSMKLVAEEADRVGGQILMEYVTKDPTSVSVMIEDGHT